MPAGGKLTHDIAPLIDINVSGSKSKMIIYGSAQSEPGRFWPNPVWLRSRSFSWTRDLGLG